MEDEYKYDGKVHLLDFKYGYILCRMYEGQNNDIIELKKKILRTYVEYLFSVNQERAIHWLAEHFFDLIEPNNHFPFMKFIYRSESQSSLLNQFSTLALKFELEGFHYPELRQIEEKFINEKT